MLEARGCPGIQGPPSRPSLRGTLALHPAEAGSMCGCPRGQVRDLCGQTTSALGLRVRPRGRHPLVGLVPTDLEAAVMLQQCWASATGARQPCPWEAVVSHAPPPRDTVGTRGLCTKGHVLMPKCSLYSHNKAA